MKQLDIPTPKQLVWKFSILCFYFIIVLHREKIWSLEWNTTYIKVRIVTAKATRTTELYVIWAIKIPPGTTRLLGRYNNCPPELCRDVWCLMVAAERKVKVNLPDMICRQIEMITATLFTCDLFGHMVGSLCFFLFEDLRMKKNVCGALLGSRRCWMTLQSNQNLPQRKSQI